MSYEKFRCLTTKESQHTLFRYDDSMFGITEPTDVFPFPFISCVLHSWQTEL